MGEISAIVEPVNVGSHTIDQNGTLPSDAADEWPASAPMRSYYFVKCRPYEDPKLKEKIDQADNDLLNKNNDRFQVTEKLRSKRMDRANVISQLKALGDEDKQFRMAMDEKRKEMDHLKHALGKLGPLRDGGGRDRAAVLCSSEEELNWLIQSMNDRIQHESISLNEEKKIIREIKLLEGTREKVIANGTVRAKIQESLGQKEDIQDQVRLMGADLGTARKDQQSVKWKIKNLEEDLTDIDNSIASLQEELKQASEKRDKAYEKFHKLRKQQEDANAPFYQNRTILKKAKELASVRDHEALEKLSQSQVDGFLSEWNGDRAFRDEYQRRVLSSSLHNRHVSKDGRDAAQPAEPEPPAPHPGPEKAPTLPEPRPHEDVRKSVAEEPSEADVAADVARRKEAKREEEMEKARLALERKKKLSEKSAAKAAARARKEEEKKLKAREKKARKKAAAGSASEADVPATADTETDSVPPEEEESEPGPAIAIRHRPPSRTGPDARRKLAALKWKKSTNYWMYAAAAAAAAVSSVALLVGFAYHYL